MIKYFFCLMLCMGFANCTLDAQADSSQHLIFSQLYSSAEEEYGVDQELMNGFLFEDINEDASGHPYFLDYFSNQGSMIYRGKPYSNLVLRYNIFDQKLLLVYTFDNVQYKLYPHEEFISEFSIGNKTFIHKAFGVNEEAKFYQVLGEDLPVKILRYWEKSLTNLYANNSESKMYTERAEAFILSDNTLLGYTGNSSFTRNFPPEKKAAIKKYLRKNKIKVMYAEDKEMRGLIEFIHSLEEQGNKVAEGYE